MEAYFKPHLAARIDRWGVRLLILLMSLVWFVGLWGLNAAALIAACAAAVMGSTLLRLGQNKTTARREAALRRRIGGELALESILTAPQRRAQFQAVLWLLGGYPGLEMLRFRPRGILCRYRGQQLLVRLIPVHPSEKTGCAPLLNLQRDLDGAQRAVALLTAPASREAQQFAAQAQPPIRLIAPETLKKLAGACHPATDEQLAALGKRQRQKANRQVWLRHILAPHRTRRYLLYGLGLMALYGLTRLPYYPVPAAILLCLAVLSKAYPRRPETL